MKNSLLYGTGAAIAAALLTFALYFIGAHNDVAKLQASNAIGALLSLVVIPVGSLVLALRAERSVAGAQGMSYGRGVLISLLVGVVAAVLGAIFTYVYGAFINPAMYETMHEAQVAAMEAQGKLTTEQIDQAAAMMKKFSTPGFGAVFYVLIMLPLYVILGLIISIFFRRAPVAVPPPPPTSATA